MTLQPLVEPVKHDDVTLRPDERMRLGSIVAGWDEEVPCDVTDCATAAQWGRRCDSCRAEWHHCTSDRRMLDTRQAEGIAILCKDCHKVQAAPMAWYPL